MAPFHLMHRFGLLSQISHVMKQCMVLILRYSLVCVSGESQDSASPLFRLMRDVSELPSAEICSPSEVCWFGSPAPSPGLGRNSSSSSSAECGSACFVFSRSVSSAGELLKSKRE